MACITDKVDLHTLRTIFEGRDVGVRKKGRNKPELFDTHATASDKNIIAVFSGESTDRDSFVDKMVKVMNSSIGSTRKVLSLAKRVLKSKQIDLEKATIIPTRNPDESDESYSTRIVSTALAFEAVVSSVKQTIDIAKKNNLNKEEKQMLIKDGEFIPSVSILGMAGALGRQIMYHRKMELKPKKDIPNKEQAQAMVDREYAIIGLKAINELSKSGAVTIHYPSDGASFAVNHNFKTPDGERFDKKNKVVEGITVSLNVENISGLNQEKMSISEKNKLLLIITGSSNKQSIYETLATNLSVSKIIKTITVPSNVSAPDTDNAKTEPKHDVVVSEDTKENLDNQAEGELIIQEDISEIMSYIEQYMADYELTAEEAIRQLGLGDFGGLINSHEESGVLALEDSDFGKTTSMKNPMIQLLENFDTVKNKTIHLAQEIKRNGRAFYMNTFLNPQTDKFGSRYMLSIKPYNMNIVDEDGNFSDIFVEVIKGILDQSSLIQNEIYNSGVNKELDELIKDYNDYFGTDKTVTKMSFLSNILIKSDVLGSGSVWEKFEIIRVVAKIRGSIDNNNNKVEGIDFLPKPDGTASGISIMSAQMAGEEDTAGSLFSGLGLKDGNSKYSDAYDIVVKHMKEVMRLNDPKASTRGAFHDSIVSALKFGLFKSMRDISKSPTMTVAYSQSKVSAENSISGDFRDRLFNKMLADKDNMELAEYVGSILKAGDPKLYAEAMADANKLEYSITRVLLTDKYSSAAFESIAKGYKKTVAKELYSIVDTHMVRKYMSKYRNRTQDIFKIIEASYKNKNQRITLPSPESIFNAVVEEMGGEFDISKLKDIDTSSEKILTMARAIDEDGSLKGNGIPMMKIFDVVAFPEKDGMVTRMEFPHSINAIVNIVHGIDFAILNEAHKRTLADDKVMELIEKTGHISIHDAIISHPAYTAAYAKNYREAFRDVNAVYSIHDMLLSTLVRMDGYDNSMDSKVKIMQAETKVEIDSKIDELANMEYDTDRIFGFADIEIENLKTKNRIKINDGVESEASTNIEKIIKTSKNPIISQFLELFDSSSIKEGDSFFYHFDSQDISYPAELDSEENIENLLAHEMVHKITYNYINEVDSKAKNQLRGSMRIMKTHEFEISNYMLDNNMDAGLERFNYIFSRENKIDSMSEFVAVMTAERQASEEITQAIAHVIGANKTREKELSENIYESAKKWFSGVISTDINKADGIISDISNALSDIVSGGIEYSKTSNKEQVRSGGLGYNQKEYSKATRTLNESASFKASDRQINHSEIEALAFLRNVDSWAIEQLYLHAGPEVGHIISRGATEVHKYLLKKSDVYTKVYSGVEYANNSKTMQQIKAYTIPSRIVQRATLHKMAVVFDRADKNSKAIISKEISLINELMNGYDKDKRSKLNSIFAHTPIYRLIEKDNVLALIATGDKTLVDALLEAEKELGSIELSKMAERMSLSLTHGIAGGSAYNMASTNIPGSKREAFSKVLALKSLSNIDGSQDQITSLYKNNPELYAKLVDSSVALANITKHALGELSRGSRLRNDVELKENIVGEFYEKNMQTIVVKRADLDSGKFDMSDDWEILIGSEKLDDYVMVYRERVGDQFQEGFGTNIGFNISDVYMPKGFTPINNIDSFSKVGQGRESRWKVIIPMDLKRDKLKLIDNPADTLVRSFSRVQNILSTQSIRNEIVKNAKLVRKIDIDSKSSIEELQYNLKNEPDETPWFLTISKENFDKLPKDIKNKYSVVNKSKLSNINGFSDSLDFVKTDLEHWLVGYNRVELFAKSRAMKKVSEIALQAISMMKIHQILVNPSKIAMDGISNVSLLMSNGINPLFIYRSIKDNTKLIAEYSQLKARRIELIMSAYSGENKYVNEISKIEKELSEHELSFAESAGIFQSNATDIIGKEFQTITGLQNNINTVLNKLSTKTNGEDGIFKSLMFKMAKSGINIEDMAYKLARAVETEGGINSLSKELQSFGKKMENIKRDEDFAAYISEFLASPSSTLTAIGSSTTLSIDRMSRLVYMDHLLSNSGKSKADMSAMELDTMMLKVSDFMPDYMFHPPVSVDALGRWFVTPYISWGLRIQRTIYMLAKSNPVTLLATIAGGELIGADPLNGGHSILGSNALSRDEYVNLFLDDVLGLGTVLPTNLFDIIPK